MESGHGSRHAEDKLVSLRLWTSESECEGEISFRLKRNRSDHSSCCRISIRTHSVELHRSVIFHDEWVRGFLRGISLGQGATLVEEYGNFRLLLARFDGRFYRSDINLRMLDVNNEGSWFGSVEEFGLTAFMIERACVDLFVDFWRDALVSDSDESGIDAPVGFRENRGCGQM